MFDTPAEAALHVIRLRAGLGVEPLAKILGMPPQEARVLVDTIREAGLVRAVRGNWIVTSDGIAADDAAVERWRDHAEPRDLELVEQFDRSFIGPNEAVKATISRWQSHRATLSTDEIATELHIAVSQLTFPLGAHTGVARVFDDYRERLLKLLDHAAGGDDSAISGIRAESFHQVWMELHAELLQLSGRARTAADGY
ncbi:MAG: hypothetical protein JWN03_5203 [Nocardia sp.]|uniref:hypothetical protein n=1 Tax=Nocardia sp. TaxID=1821 RepID=UPI0026019449|nr:hypothetical protein [Nocardia sp.]MCU1644928.1 hypothetical protein [Nocardia sp.]